MIKRDWKPRGYLKLPFTSHTITEAKLPGDLMGYCKPNGKIVIDYRLKAFRYMETLVHELLHRHIPMASEEWVTANATIIAAALWEKRIRRIEE